MGRPKAFDEEAVLDRAVELFWERGYEGTSVSDLEAGLGIGRQSLYNAFGDKQTLYLKALERYTRHQGTEGPLQLLTAPDAGLGAIRAYLEELVAIGESTERPRVCMIVNGITERAGTDPDTRLRCDRARRSTHAAFMNALMRARARGEVRGDLDPDATALMLTGLVYGFSVLTKAGVPPAELRASAEAALRALT